MNAPTPPDHAMDSPGPDDRGMSLGSVPTRVWVGLALLVVAVLFVAQNRDGTEIQILFVSLTAPLWATLTVAVGVGVLIGLLLRPSERRKRKASRK